ncbi:Gfo/Idh/MocA family oxidoreductase [Nocardia vinacea]|uniref:Gfo/Idh/MocA family oxidoreductase n=1 Tax=Nocardia vinacea TaxID=96468 RepID=A0ABZ1YTT9_9NOCA|nr:Gfo/Idh/MocA family oxidoreductase [Nocardia vinacea]
MTPSAKPPIRVGLTGLSSTGGWAATAHLPALAAVEGLELAGLATSSIDSARAAATAYGVPLAFDNVHQLATHDDIDLVVVAVKVPLHRELLLPILATGKPVLCEWPLAVGFAEAEELTKAADGLRSFVGLQARSSPSMRYLRDLVADGYIGELLSTSLIASGRMWGLPVTNRTLYLLDRAQGATMLTIPFGHTIDCLTMVLGEFTEITATTSTRRSKMRNTDTGELVPMTAEDQIAVTGVLANGAVASVHYRGGSSRGTNFLWEINGTEGDLRVHTDSGSLQLGRATIYGSRGGDSALAELAVPARYDLYPGLAGQPAHNVAHAYTRILHDLIEDTRGVPDFTHALDRHQLLEAIQHTAATGVRHQISRRTE